MLIIDIIDIAAKALSIVIIAHVVLSWVPHDPHQKGFRLVHRLALLLLEPFRFIPAIGGLDLAPIAALFTIQLIERFLIQAVQNFL